MNYFPNNKKVFTRKIYIFLTLASIYLSIPLNAQTLMVGLGFENGKTRLNQEQFLRNDAMINENKGQILTNTVSYVPEFSSNRTTAPYIKLRGGWDLFGGELFLGGSYIDLFSKSTAINYPQYSQTDLGSIGSVSGVINYNINYMKRKNTEYEIGYKLDVIKDKFSIAPRIGKRNVSETFFTDHTGISVSNIQGQNITGVIYDKANKKKGETSSEKAGGSFTGFEFLYAPSDRFNLGIDFSYGNLTGDQFQSSYIATFFSVSTVSSVLAASNTETDASRAKINFERTVFSLEYNFTKKFHLRTTFETEDKSVSYPEYDMLYNVYLYAVKLNGKYQGYYNITSVNPEFLSDSLIYNDKSKVSEKKMTLGLVMNFDYRR